MAFRVLRFATFWIFSASCTPAIERQHHPLCHTLSDLEHPHPTHFPSAYVCHGNEHDAICTPWIKATSGISAIKGDGNDTMVEPAVVRWWVYEGRRQRISSPVEDSGVGEWVDCTEYFARRSPALGPGKGVGTSSRIRNGNISQSATPSDGLRRELRRNADALSTVKETTPGFSVGQELRTLQVDGARGGSAGIQIAASRAGSEESAYTNSDNQRHDLVYAPNATCNDFWLAWPAMQDRAIARGTVVVFDLNDSVGNLFRTLALLMQFVRLLDLGLILRWTEFPGFREAFGPGEIEWDIDAGPFLQDMDGIEGGAHATDLHHLYFRNYAMVLSHYQLELLALTLDIKGGSGEYLASHFANILPGTMNRLMREVLHDSLEKNTALRRQPCAWNMLLNRSPSMIARLDKYSPWGTGPSGSASRHQTMEYVAIHIRTSDGETAGSYTDQPYVIQEPSSIVCSTFLVAVDDALQRTSTCLASLSVHADDPMVYISSNSKPMAKNCTLEAANDGIVMGHVDMGLQSSDAHTAFSKHPLQTALGAFLDFLFMMDSAVIVRTSSSFSGTVTDIKGLACHRKVYNSLPNRHMFLCLPPDC